MTTYTITAAALAAIDALLDAASMADDETAALARSVALHLESEGLEVWPLGDLTADDEFLHVSGLWPADAESMLTDVRRTLAGKTLRRLCASGHLTTDKITASRTGTVERGEWFIVGRIADITSRVQERPTRDDARRAGGRNRWKGRLDDSGDPA